MMEPISIVNTEAPEEDLISIDTGAKVNPVKPERAAEKAYKMQYGGVTGVTGLDYDAVYQRLLDGDEQLVREHAASELQYRKRLLQQNAIQAKVREKGEALSPADIDFLTTTETARDKSWHPLETKPWPIDPDSVVEEAYANKYFDNINEFSKRQDTLWSEAKEEIPEQVERVEGTARTMIAKIEFAKTLQGEVADALEQQSWVGFGVDVAKGLAPFYNELKLRGNVPTTGMLEGGLLGENLDKQTRDLLRKPFAEYKTQLKEIVDKLKEDNPQIAAAFLAAVLGQSTSERFLNNTFTLFDVSTLGGLAKASPGLFRKAKLSNDSVEIAKDLIKSTEVVPPTKATAAAATGDLAEASVQTATTRLIKNFKGNPNPEKDVMDMLPRFLKQDVEDIKANPGLRGQDTVNRLEARTNALISNVDEAVKTLMRVERLPEAEASEKLMRVVQEAIRDDFPDVSNGMLEISSPYKNKVTNTWHADVAIGKPSGELFRSKEQAIGYAKYMGLPFDDVRRQGAGFYIVKKSHPINETSDVVRSVLMETTNSKTPDSYLNSFVNGFIGRFRTSEEVLSLDQRMNRKVATYNPQAFLKLAQDTASEIGQLAKFKNRKEWKDWERVVKASRTLIDPESGKPGFFFKSPGELESFYQTHIKRLPTDGETDAYFAFKRVIEVDRIFRELSVYRNKVRVGTENHTISLFDLEGKRVTSEGFEGVVRKTLPGGEGTMVVFGKRIGDEKKIQLGRFNNPKYMEKLRNDVASGKLKVIEIFDPEVRPLAAFSAKTGTDRVRYAVVESVESRPLSFEQVPRRGGGHFDYDYEFYIKQAKVRPQRIDSKTFYHWYEGDTTIMPVKLRAMGEDVAKKLDQVRLLIRNKDIAGAKKLVNDQLHMDWKEVHGWFRPKKVDGVLQQPMLSLDERIQVVRGNATINSIDDTLSQKYASTFKDGTKEGSLARQYQVAYTSERDSFDLKTITDRGTRGNPLYAVEPAQLVDPIPMMDRALSRIIHSTFMDDYKIFSVEHWLKEASKYIDAKDGEIWHSPFYYFHNGKFRAGVESEIAGRLETQRMHIKQFLGEPSTSDKLLHSFSQKLADSVYRKAGAQTYTKSASITPHWMLPFVKDPFSYLRSVAYHPKLGFYNPAQLVVQAQTYSTILGVAGLRPAISGTYGAYLATLARINKNPAIIAKLDEMATKIKMPGSYAWKRGEWKEAWEEFTKSTGFRHVGGEVAMKDDLLTPSTVNNEFKAILNFGTVFFREGERLSRTGGWFTAFKEFRQANPTKVLTDLDRRMILERADLLTVNMSRASSSSLHTGVLSLPTQFLSYQIRAAELFMGKRLDMAARARLIGAYSALYGVPTAAAVTGFPAADYIRKAATDMGYVVGDSWIQSTFMEGLPAAFGALVTGGFDSRRGNWYNVGDRFGAQGFETIREALRGDRTMWDIIGGASFSVLANTWEMSDGLWKAAGSMIRGDGEFKLKVEDVIDAAKEISTVNNAWRSLVYAQTGNFISKKGGVLEKDKDPSVSNAVFMFLSGLQSQGASDIQLLSWSLKDQKNVEKYVRDKFVVEMRRGFDTHEDSPDQAKVFYKRALAYLKAGGYPEHKMGELFSLAMKDRESLVDRLNWTYYFKDAPAGTEATRLQALKKIMKIKEIRGAK